MTGGEKARWVDEDMADVLTAEALSYLEERSKAGGPFFLYFATHDIHVPRAPHPRFAGKSGMGPRGDAILELDDCVGRLLDALDRLGLAANTLVIFTSDNGPVINDGYRDRSEELLGEHRAAGPWRGGKYSNFEAGTRVPFLVRWPGHVERGVSGALISQVDLFASLASLVGAARREGDAPDSADQLQAILGRDKVGRVALIEQAGVLSLREGNLKFVPASQRQPFDPSTKTELGNAPEDRLFDLAVDPGETRNLAGSRPDDAARLKAMLARIRGEDR
jgi:arylsulfatase A-like enzyme